MILTIRGGEWRGRTAQKLANERTHQVIAQCVTETRTVRRSCPATGHPPQQSVQDEIEPQKPVSVI